MVAKVDNFGRVLIPKEARDRLGLRPGSEVELVQDADSLCLRPIAQHPHIAQRNGLPCIEGLTLESDVALVEFIAAQRDQRMRHSAGLD